MHTGGFAFRRCPHSRFGGDAETDSGHRDSLRVPRRIQAGAPCEEIYLARALVERPVQEGVDAELQRRRTPWSWEAALASRALLGKVHHESN